jgi:glycosyltransferase involved in cell wall biosynthesis
LNANPRVVEERPRALAIPAQGERVVIDALQVSPAFSGVGREMIELGHDLSRMNPPLRFEVRCARDMEPRFRRAFPDGTTFDTPLRTSRPRSLRVLYQQFVAPFRDDSSTVLICIGDQAPVWGRSRLIYVLNDVRRLTHPSTASMLERLYYRLVVARASRRADRLLTISEFSRGEIERVLEPSRPVDVIAIHPGAGRPREAAPEADGRLLVVGAMRPYKGLETVIDALGWLKRQGDAPVPEVVFAGGAEGSNGLVDELRTRASLAGVSDKLTFTGWIEDRNLESLYRSATATINPSTYEGYGLSVAESLAWGLPTIASDIPSHREIAEEGALFVPPGDAEALAGAIREIAGDARLRRTLAERGRERAAELAESGPSWGEAILGALEVRDLEPV